MTREEKIDEIINALVYTGEMWGSYKDYNLFVAGILKHGHKGYHNMTDEEIDQDHAEIFMTED